MVDDNRNELEDKGEVFGRFGDEEFDGYQGRQRKDSVVAGSHCSSHHLSGLSVDHAMARIRTAL